MARRGGRSHDAAQLFINAVLFVAISGGIGFATAHYAVENGTRFVTRQSGPWTQWTMLGRPDAEPYARAHMVRKGMVPVATTVEQAFVADSDSAGGWLNAACEYRSWWVTPKARGGVSRPLHEEGAARSHAADRYAFNVDTAMQEADGRAVVTLGGTRTGNWLPIGGGGAVAW